MRKLQLLVLCLSALLVFIQAVPICLLFDPAVVDTASTPIDSEPQTIRGAALASNHTIVLLENSISVAAWEAALPDCAVLVLPEFETGTFLPVDETLSQADRNEILGLIRSFTSRGGLVISFGSPDNIDFLNIAFAAPYNHGEDLFGGDVELNRTVAGQNTAPFNAPDAPSFLLDWDASFTASDVPADECMYQGDDPETCAVSFARYNDGTGVNATAGDGGAYMYVSWDFWDAAPLGSQVGGGWVPLLFDQVINEDCDNNMIVDSLQMDCDANQIADVCEIAEDASLDCNGNQLLDSCELTNETAEVLDCNGNGILDSCEIADNADLDCDHNNVLDSCQDTQPDCENSSTGVGNDGADGATGTNPTGGDGDGGDGDGATDGNDTSSAAVLRGWTLF